MSSVSAGVVGGGCNLCLQESGGESRTSGGDGMFMGVLSTLSITSVPNGLSLHFDLLTDLTIAMDGLRDDSSCMD